MQAQPTQSSHRRLETTKTPGVFKRGNRYVVVYRDPSGRQRKAFAPTLAAARDVKATLRADVARGEYRALSKVTFAEYAESWIETYAGRTSRGVRPLTREDYKKRLEQEAIPFFGRMRLAAIEPRDVKAFASRVASRGPVCRACRNRDDQRPRCKRCAGSGHGPGSVAANTVRLALAPVKALLATAVEDGVIRSNPAAGLRLALEKPRTDEDGAERVKALTEEELAALLTEIPETSRLFFEFLSQTGLRIGEAIALRWQDVDLGRRRVLVRRRYYRRTFAPPKSRYGHRDVPLTEQTARALWSLRKERPNVGDGDLVFVSSTGELVDQSNLASRILKPAARRAGVPWVGFHAFRHTCATMLFRHGLNAKQVQVWLGHHSPAFTLATYVHLLPDDLPEAPFGRPPAVAVAPPATGRTSLASPVSIPAVGQ